MAKQKGLHKLAGKVDEQSYYYSKNGGYQSRKINPGIGERVKSAPEYANTRLNNAEFGAAGACAGAMIREVTKRWRYILDSIATGKMVKVIKALMEQDTTSPWGQRVVKLADMPTVQEKYNQFSKNPMPELIVNYLTAQTNYAAGTSEINFGLADEVDLAMDAPFVDFLNSIGATNVRISLYAFSCSNPTFVEASHKYLAADSSIALLSVFQSNMVDVGEVIIAGDHVTTPIAPLNSQIAFGGVLAIFEPLRNVGTTTAVLQQHCSAFWTPINAAV